MPGLYTDREIREKMSTRKNKLDFFKDGFFILPVLSALLLGLSRYPLKLNFVVFFAFIPFLYLIDYDVKRYLPFKRRKILKAALCFSTTYTLVTLYWISVVTVPGFLGLFILFGFYFYILYLVIFKVKSCFPKWGYLIFISAWIAFEWLTSFGQLQFPWFNIGYALAEYTFLIQAAEYGGIYLLTLIILVINILLYRLIKFFPGKKALVSGLAAFLILMIWSITGIIRYKNIELTDTDFKAAMVQVSIPQYMKWTPGFFDNTLNLYEQYSFEAAKSEPDLIIWPEAAIPDYVLRSERSKYFVKTIADSTGIPIFLGMPHYEMDGEDGRALYYNAATLFREDGTVELPYYKIILVPVGERIPFMDYIPFLGNLDFGQANWEYGKKPVFYSIEKDNEEYIFSPIICFEIAFPNLARRIAREKPDFFVNITNDAWFERTIGPYQHAMMTVIRAVETRTQFYRAANTGITMVVDPSGKILNQTELFEKTVLTEHLKIYPSSTMYVDYLRNYPAIFFFISAMLLLLSFCNVFMLSKLE